jgi:lipopolysaccharide export system permease protein
LSQRKLQLSRLLWPIILLVLGTALSCYLVPSERAQVAEYLVGFPDANPFWHQLRPVILIALVFLPFIFSVIYSFSSMISRWLQREFFIILSICYGGILMIYLLFDLSQKAAEFSGGKGLFVGAVYFYSRMSPSLLSQLLPFGLLISVLLCLNKISRSREIIAALQSGRSIFQVTLPLYIAGFFCAIFVTCCNFYWAPRAEALEKAFFDEIRGVMGSEVKDRISYFSDGGRLWKVGIFPRDYLQGAPLLNVEVTSLSSDGSLLSRLYAKQAFWFKNNRRWEFIDAEVATYRKDTAPYFQQFKEPLIKRNWNENPAQIIKLIMSSDYLGVPELSDRLREKPKDQWEMPVIVKNRAQWHHRWAHSVIGLIFVMLAIPIAVNLSRKGGSSFGVAIIFCAILMFTSSLFLALGEKNYLPTVLSVWLPNIVFIVIAIYLMIRRSAGKTLLPRFSL